MAALTLYPTDTATSSPFPTTSRLLSVSAPSSEVSLGPGEFDSGLPGNTDAGQWKPASALGNTTAAAEIDNAGGSDPSATREGWLYDVDLAGKVVVRGAWGVQLRLNAVQGSGQSGRICARVSIVTGSSGSYTTVKTLFTTRVTGATSTSGGQAGWRDQNEARITVTSTTANFSVTIGGETTTLAHTFQTGERIFVELGFCDANNTTDRTWRLDYNTSNVFITTPDIHDVATPAEYYGDRVKHAWEDTFTDGTGESPEDVLSEIVPKSFFGENYNTSTGTWDDDVGGASTVNFTQATANRRPGITTTPAGYTVLSVDDATNPDFMLGGGLGSTSTETHRIWHFIFKTTKTSNQYIWRTDNDEFNTITSGKLSFGFGGCVSNANLVADTWYRAIGVATANSVKMWLNGTKQTAEGNDAAYGSGWFGTGFFNRFELFHHNDADPFGGEFGALACNESDGEPADSWFQRLDAALYRLIDNSARWTDSISGANAEQSGATLKPAATTTPADMLAVEFDATSSEVDYLETAGGQTPPGGSVAMQIAGTFRVDSGDGTGTLFSVRNSSDTVLFDVVLDTTSGVTTIEAGSETSSTISGTGWKTIVVDFRSDDTFYVYVNGVAVISAGTIDTSALIAGVDNFVFGSVPGDSARTFALGRGWTIAYSDSNFTLDTDAEAVDTLLQAFITGAGGAYTLTAETVGFSLTGYDAALGAGRLLSAEEGALSLTGYDATLARGQTMAAETVGYTLTGYDAATTAQRRLTAELGAFALTGVDAGLNRGYPILAEPGAFVLTGVDAALLADRQLLAESGTFTLTGYDATVLAGRRILAESGAFVLTGQDIEIPRGVRLLAETGLYVLTGYDTNFSQATTLSAEVGTFALTGYDANLLRAVRLLAENASFALSGYDANFARGYITTAESGTFTLTGYDAGMLVGRVLVSEEGVFALTGYDADLVYVPPGNVFTLDAESGVFVLTGQNADLLAGRQLAAESSAFALTGYDAALLAGRRILAEPGALTVTGYDAATVASRRITAEPGGFIVTGVDASLIGPGGQLLAEPGSFVLTGYDAGTRAARRLNAESGTVNIAGSDTVFRRAIIVVAEPATFLVTGFDVGLRFGAHLLAEPGSFVLTGSDAELRAARVLLAAQGVFVLTGYDMQFGGSYFNRFSSGAFTVLSLTPLQSRIRDLSGVSGLLSLSSKSRTRKL